MKIPMTTILRPDTSNDKGYRILVVCDEQKWMVTLPDDVIIEEGREIEIPDISSITQKELTLKAIQTLRDRKIRKQAELQKELEELDGRIEKLLMLTYDPSHGTDNVIEMNE